MYRFFIAFFTMFINLTPLNSYGQDFVAGFEDIPLYKGMIQQNNNNISFNNEETRYIEATIISDRKISIDEFKSFYIKTLQELGWELKENSDNLLKFYRENDILDLKILKITPLKALISMKNRY